MGTGTASPPGSIANPSASDVARAWDCQICSGASRREFMAEGHWVRSCQECGHRFAEIVPDEKHVEEVYGDKYFFGGGAGYQDYLSESQLLIARGARYGRLAKKFIDVGDSFDVGAAAGFTMKGLESEGWRPHGLEPNATMAAYAQEQFGFDVASESLESWSPRDDAAKKFQLVTGLQIIPHFADPSAAMSKMADLTASGGLVIIETWDYSSWTARWLGKSWHAYNPPSTLHWFSRASLNQLAEKAGLKTIAGGRAAKWIDAGHAKSILSHKLKSSWVRSAILGPASLVPNQLAIPYLADDLFWAAYRKSE